MTLKPDSATALRGKAAADLGRGLVARATGGRPGWWVTGESALLNLGSLWQLLTCNTQIVGHAEPEPQLRR